MKIVITGAGSGIGKDAAFALAERGHIVFATTRTEVQAEVLQKEANTLSLANFFASKVDILLEEDQVRVAALLPDILISNAALGMSGPVAGIPLEHVRRVFETNVFATLSLTQKIAAQFVRQKSGRIIFISSVAGKITLPYLGPYSMTKHAVESMNDALRQELAPHGISVSAIEPGAIGTGFNEKMNATKYAWLDDSIFKQDRPLIERYEKMLVHNQASTASIVAAIVHAVESEKPKTRYVAPKGIRAAVWLAKFTPDRLRDTIIRRGAKR